VEDLHGRDEGSSDRTVQDVSPEAVLEVVLSQTGLSAADVRGERSLPRLGVNSFAIMRLVLILEEEFDIEFPSEAMRALLTVPTSQIHELVLQARMSSPD
jgi:acyl carrier protein